jgi:hypothetical protein
MELRRSRTMKTSVAMAAALCAVFMSSVQAQSLPMQNMSGLLRLVQTGPLPTEGYMDHMAVDVKGQRLFISGEASKTIVVVDLKTGNVIHEVKGLGGPHSQAVLSSLYQQTVG